MESILPYIEGVGKISGAGVLMIGMTYLFLMRFADRAFNKFGLEMIKLPFGIILKRSSAEDNADADALVIEGLYETGQQLEYRAKEKMRAVMQHMAYDHSAKHPEWREYILRGRIAIAAAISDNHIVYALTDEKIHDYIEMKQDQVVAAVCEKMSPDAEQFIRNSTAEFFVRIIKVQKWICIEKINAYEEALHRFKMNGSRVRCETKIQKNKKYLNAIADIDGSAISEKFNIEQSSIYGKSGDCMVKENIERIKRNIV